MMSAKSCEGLKGDRLIRCQRTAKRELKKEYGGSHEPRGAGLLMWGRTRIDEKVGKMVPIPPQADTFTDFKKKNAEKLADELKKLKGEPVILSGGGGYGYKFAFLNDVELIQCGYPPLRNPFNQFIVRDTEGNWIEDKSKPIQCSIEVSLKTFEGEKRTPHIGSWRITALHGYGAERLLKKVPRTWETD